MKPSSISSRITRRDFLGGMAASAAAFQVVPGSVLGLNGQTAPSQRLNVAGVGVAGQGGHDISQFTKENIVALCDADWAHAAGTFKRFPDARKFKDYRKMLEEVKEIDAVVVATPDHHHAFASMEAIKRGKHVYCEKPLTHSVWEARQVATAARARKIATQMGNQGQASDDSRRLAEMVWSGAIGKVREAHVWTDRPSQGLFGEYWPQGVVRPKETPEAPSTLDWQQWLGPAPERPFNPAYLPFKWRGWWDFGTGALGDIGCHALDPVCRALKLGSPIVWREKAWDPAEAAPEKCFNPVSIQASSSRVNKETYPLASMVTYEFPARADAPPIKVMWYDGGLRPARPLDLPEDVAMGDNGRMIVGDRGYILGSTLYPEARRKEVGEIAKLFPRVRDHYQEWAEACKGGKPAGSNFDWAGPLAEIVLLGNVALRVELRQLLVHTRLKWDPLALRVSNVEEANKFIKRDYRQGWSLA